MSMNQSISDKVELSVIGKIVGRSVRHRWIVLLGAIALLVISFLLSSSIGINTGEVSAVGESQKGVQLIEDRFEVLNLVAGDTPLTLPGTAQIVPSQNGPTDATELEAFLDSFFAEEMEDRNIPGAAFVMVKDGEVFLQKGYGFADLDRQVLVDPERTVFRAGSVSKLFTWTAVMQLVEQGMLAPDADVNQYIDEFQVPTTYSQPVNVRALMTHTAGFEDSFIGLYAREEKDFEQLAENVRANVPQLVNAPGLIHSYNNYSATLAGYLVEQTSGLPFAEYVDEFILQPLNMEPFNRRRWRISTFSRPDQLPTVRMNS